MSDNTHGLTYIKLCTRDITHNLLWIAMSFKNK